MPTDDRTAPRSILALVCLVSLGLTLGSQGGATAQAPGHDHPEPLSTDWLETVEKAQNHKRMMLRRAASRKVAAAGDAAIPAVRAFEKKHGRAALRLEFVGSYSQAKSRGEATLALLEEWARDVDFYWRSQALEALANRRLPAYRKLYLAHLQDRAHLTRIQAGRGICLLGGKRDEMIGLLRDEDPRVRLRIAVCLVEENDDRGLPVLVEALRQDASFMDYPWGRLGAQTALRTLRKVAGKDFEFQPGGSPTENRAAILEFEAFAKKRLEDRWVDPVPAFTDAATYTAGAAIRSCRNGDLYVRFTADRHIVFGLEAKHRVPIPTDEWAALWKNSPGEGKAVRGKVVCDYLRVMCQNPTMDEKFAPGTMKNKTAKWLEGWARTLEERGRSDLAKQITSRLDQFTIR